MEHTSIYIRVNGDNILKWENLSQLQDYQKEDNLDS